MAEKTTYDLLAVTGCPTGIAHTYMAKEALEKAAAAKGLTIKVETQGQVGAENEVTPAEIRACKAVIIAADKDVQPERFEGKPLISVGVTAAIKDPDGLIDKALAAKAEGELSAEVANASADEVVEKESIGHQIYRHLMNGVSHMLVFVVAGGVLTALSFLWGITSYDSTASDYNSFAAMLKIIGGIAMNLMVPVLSAYIAESIGKRPALVPGFVAGMISIQGLPVNAETGLIDAGGAGVGFGFLGGIIGGFLAGYVIVALEKVFSGLPQSLNGLKAMFLYPLCSTFIVGLVMLGISGPMAAINQAMMDFLQGLYNAGPVPLGLAIGCMCAFDMGGPVNKAAYTTGTLLLTEAIAAGVGTEAYNFGTNFMAAVSAACIVPPLITTFAVIVGKKYFSQEDHDAGLVNFILGCTHITEGAIPFAVKDNALVIAVTGGAWAAQDLVTVCAQLRRELIDAFGASYRKRHMNKAGARERFLGILHVLLVHDLEPRSVFEGEEVRAEARGGVMVQLAGARGTEIALKEGFGALEVVYIHGEVLDMHRCSRSAHGSV